jgi:hypothetical protein
MKQIDTWTAGQAINDMLRIHPLESLGGQWPRVPLDNSRSETVDDEHVRDEIQAAYGQISDDR